MPPVMLLQTGVYGAYGAGHLFGPEIIRKVYWPKQAKDNKGYLGMTRFFGTAILALTGGIHMVDKNIKDHKARKDFEKALGLMNLVWAAEVQYNIHIGNMDKTQGNLGTVLQLALAAVTLKSAFEKK